MIFDNELIETRIEPADQLAPGVRDLFVCRLGEVLKPFAMPPPSLDEVANLSLSVGKLFLETGASARTVNEAVEEISRAFGCEKAEAYCQHAAIIVMLRRGADSSVEMGKVGEYGVNLRRAEALSRIVSHIALGEIGCAQAQREVDNGSRTAPGYSVWFVCLATGIACAAFGRLLHATWLSFVPTLVGAAAGQWLRHCLLGRKQNVFLVVSVVSLVSAFVAGLGGRLLRRGHLEIATVAAVLLVVPGVAVLNAQLDANRTPFGPRTVAARYSPQSRYRPGYFDDLIPADFIKIAGFKKRVRVEGLGVPLVGVRERGQRTARPSYSFSHRIVAPMWRWDALQNFSPIEMAFPNANRHLRPRSDREDANRWPIDSPRRRFHRSFGAVFRGHQRPNAGDSRYLECGGERGL